MFLTLLWDFVGILMHLLAQNIQKKKDWTAHENLPQAKSVESGSKRTITNFLSLS